MALKPPALLAADYGLATRPHLGGEIQVYATTAPAGIVLSKKNIGGGIYETKNSNASGFGGTRAVVVGYQGLHGAIAGIIAAPSWSPDQSTDFGTGIAGEGSIPGVFGIRGDELFEVDIPDFNPEAVTPNYREIGCTTEKRIKLPSRMNKAISCGMISARWTPPGKTEIGELTITAKNPGHVGGLLKLAGLKTTICLRVVHDNVLEIARIYILDWTPTIDRSDPDADGESEVTATGIFSMFAAFNADGQ